MKTVYRLAESAKHAGYCQHQHLSPASASNCIEARAAAGPIELNRQRVMALDHPAADFRELNPQEYAALRLGRARRARPIPAYTPDDMDEFASRFFDID